jgi:hypothetical protein
MMAPLSTRNVTRQAPHNTAMSSFGHVETFLATPFRYRDNEAGRQLGADSIG